MQLVEDGYKLPTIEWTNPNHASDEESWGMVVGIEKYTGLPLISRQRLLFNYVIETTSQATNETEIWLVPLYYMAREFVWS